MYTVYCGSCYIGEIENKKELKELVNKKIDENNKNYQIRLVNNNGNRIITHKMGTMINFIKGV